MSSHSEHTDADLGHLRGKITELISQNALAMVQCAIDAVKEDGQYQAIKYLFEMVGLHPAAAGTESTPDDSLAQTLLKRLGLENESVSGSSLKH